MKAKNGDVVAVRYTGMTKKDKKVFDSNVDNDKPALEFELGKEGIIKGFNDAVIDMEEGEEKEVEIPMDKAYGPKNPNMVLKVPRDKLPADLKPEEGMTLALKSPEGQVMPGKIVKVEDESLTVDMNFPVAGEDLIFKIKLEKIVKSA